MNYTIKMVEGNLYTLMINISDYTYRPMWTTIICKKLTRCFSLVFTRVEFCKDLEGFIILVGKVSKTLRNRAQNQACQQNNYLRISPILMQNSAIEKDCYTHTHTHTQKKPRLWKNVGRWLIYSMLPFGVAFLLYIQAAKHYVNLFHWL
jgi:hypothetical protein